MAGDFSRNTFDSKKHYAGVLMQQGRVQLDADWNEQQAIHQHRAETTTNDLIGPSGAPSQNPGFAIITDASQLSAHEKQRLRERGVSIFPLEAGNFMIGRGRYYVDGILCENDEFLPYVGQPDLPGVEPLSQLGLYLVYLDVWQRHITALDDPLIREVALGGADTTTRLKTVWQVRVMRILGSAKPVTLCNTSFPEWEKLITPSSGMLNARAATFSNAQQPCELAPSSGYQRLENQLYRVEIHRGGDREWATFKWSRENGSVETTIEKIEGNVVTVTELGKDAVRGFGVEQWVEIIDSESELTQKEPHVLLQIEEIDTYKNEITVKPPQGMSLEAIASRPGLKLRRWDQTGSDASADGLILKDGSDWLELEGGIQLHFSEGSYRSGDYWLIPARTATGDIEWPKMTTGHEMTREPAPQLPIGVKHHYSRLAILRWDGEAIHLLNDCREQFPSATNLTADYIHYNTPPVEDCEPMVLNGINQDVQNAQTVAGILDGLLCRFNAKHLPLDRDDLAPLLQKELNRSVQDGLNWLATKLQGQMGMATVGEGGLYPDLMSAFRALSESNDVALYLLPGQPHLLPADFTAQTNRCIKLEGAGSQASVLQPSGDVTFKSSELILRDLGFDMVTTGASATLEAEKFTVSGCRFRKRVNNMISARVLADIDHRCNSWLAVAGIGFDGRGHPFVVGTFKGIVTFGNNELRTWDDAVFVARLDGNFEHHKALTHTRITPDSTCSVNGMAVDHRGNVVVTGMLSGAVRFRFLDSGIVLKSHVEGKPKEDAFVAKLNEDLEYVALRLLADTSHYKSEVDIAGVTTCSDGSVVVAGDFSGTIRVGNYDSSKLESPGPRHGFVAKLDPDLKHDKSYSFGGGSEDDYLAVRAIARDSDDNMFVVGEFRGQVKMAMAEGQDVVLDGVSKGAFVLMLDPDLNYLASCSLACMLDDEVSKVSVRGITVDNENNVLVAGMFSGILKTDGGNDDKAPQLILESSQVEEGFLVKLLNKKIPTNGGATTKRQLIAYRAQSLHGVINISGIASDRDGNAFLTGQYQGKFGLGQEKTADSEQLNSKEPAGFMVVFDRYLKYLWSRSFEGDPTGLAIDVAGNVVVSGQFHHSLTFGVGTELKSEGNDAFIARFAGTEVPLVKVESPAHVNSEHGESQVALMWQNNRMENLWSWRVQQGTSQVASKPWEVLVLQNNRVGGIIENNRLLGHVCLVGESPERGSSYLTTVDSRTVAEGLPFAISRGANLELRGNEIGCLVSKVDRDASSLYAHDAMVIANNIFHGNENSLVCGSLAFSANQFPKAGDRDVAATVVGRLGAFFGNAAQSRGAVIKRYLVDYEWKANLLEGKDPPFSYTPTSASFSPTGAKSKVSVTAATMHWYIEVEQSVGWLGLIPPDEVSGDLKRVKYAGSGDVKYEVADNWNVEERATTLVIGDQFSADTLARFSVNQAGVWVRRTDSGSSFGVQGGKGEIEVRAPEEWKAESNADWIEVTKDSTRGMVRYHVEKNTGENRNTSARAATITIARQDVRIEQDGASLSLEDPPNLPFNNSGGTLTVQVDATRGHEWRAVPLDSWVRILSGGSGTGPGSFRYKVTSKKTNNTRKTAINVGGQTYPITQTYKPPRTD